MKGKSAAIEAKTISIFGSTGSIGRSTISIIQENPSAFIVETLVAHSDVATLAAQAKAVRAKQVVVADDSAYEELQKELFGTSIQVASGAKAVMDSAAQPVDIAMCAIVGIAGLAPTYNAIKASKIVALANKESIVCAGPILKKLAMQYGTKLIPVDSEHSALMQALSGGSISAVKQAIITASGGPFLNRSLKSLADVTPEEAVRHPNWSMGAKISVDSATMMNKVLELIEAQHLFDLHVDQLDVLLHPESIIHGMIEYIDGSVIAQMSMPDMRTSIAVALYYPNHQSISYQPIPWKQLGNLSFAEIDAERFPAINLAKPVMEAGMQAAIVLNAANEEAVQAFLQRKISFTDIFQTVEKALSKYVNQNSSIKNLQEIFALDHQTRAKIRISLGLGQLKSCMVA